jgi:dipeptidyl aminopeptidase/acylaminoacyl peptidase
MNIKTSFFILFITLSQGLFAQNGVIVSQTKVQLADSILQRVAKHYPEVIGFNDSTSAYRITYLSDGLRVNGYLVMPKKEGKYPCIIYNRGGNREFGKLDHGDYGYYMAQIASWGYVVIGSQYRGNDGGQGKEEFGGKDVNDVLNLLPVLAHIEKADTSRIGMYGVSRGGMMTYIALKKTKRLKGAVVVSGIADLIKLIVTRPAMDTGVYQQLIPNYATEKTRQLKERSAVYFADSLCKSTPLLIFQGTADWRVPADQVLDLTEKLYAAKVPFRFSLFEGGTHGVDEFWDEVSHQTRLFLDLYVRDKTPLPSLVPHGF